MKKNYIITLHLITALIYAMDHTALQAMTAPQSKTIQSYQELKANYNANSFLAQLATELINKKREHKAWACPETGTIYALSMLQDDEAIKHSPSLKKNLPILAIFEISRYVFEHAITKNNKTIAYFRKAQAFAYLSNVRNAHNQNIAFTIRSNYQTQRNDIQPILYNFIYHPKNMPDSNIMCRELEAFMNNPFTAITIDKKPISIENQSFFNTINWQRLTAFIATTSALASGIAWYLKNRWTQQ